MTGEVRLFIASPSYTQSFCSGYVESLANTIKDLHDHGIRTLYKTVDGVHWIDIARDVLAHVFLHTNCTHMIQIDSDLAWDADAPRRMLDSGKDIVGGAYRIKSGAVNTYAVKDKNNELQGLAGGFVMVSRKVIEDMSARVQPYSVSTLQYGLLSVAPLYTREFSGGSYVGEDYMFCRRAIEAGYELSLLDDINFRHYGIKSWDGNYKDYKHAVSNAP